MARQYLDFDLAIEPTGEGRYVARVLHSPAGEAEATFDWPFSAQDLEIFILRVGHTRRGTRRSDSPEMGHARDFGRTLYETVFTGAARTALIRSIDEAERLDAGLRIRLRLGSSPQLNDVPWEYLFSEDLNRFLIVSAETPIVRYVDLQRRIRPITVTLPLHILAVVSAPTDLPDLDVEGEWRRLEQALANLTQTESVTLERLREPTLERLQERLRRDQVHVLHFIGHGAFLAGSEEGVLFFTNERGGSHPVTGEDLGTVLHDHRSLRLVVLNSCEGARSDPADPFSGSAQALVGQGIPAVIAMQFEITDKAALTIAKNFYGSLADGYAVDAALAEARKAIFSQGNDVEWGTPVLYMRAPDGQLFDLDNATARAGEPAAPTSPTNISYDQGRAAAGRREWSTAIPLLEEALEEDPENENARALLEEVRRHQLAENLYRGAGFLAAAEQWDAVLERLRDIEALDVGGEDPEDLRQQAVDAIEARQQTEWLQEQLDQARAALGDSEWAEATERARAVLADHPEHAEAQRILTEATDRAAVATLHELARTSADAGRWDQVLKRLDEIEAIDISYLDDVDDLRARAVAGQAEQARMKDLDTRYEGALALIEAKQWDQALSLIDALAVDQPGYRGVEQLRERVATELESERQIATTAAAERQYVDAIRASASGDHEKVVAALDKIDQIAPDFGDPEGLRGKTSEALAKVAQLSQPAENDRAADTRATQSESSTVDDVPAEPTAMNRPPEVVTRPALQPAAIAQVRGAAADRPGTRPRWRLPAWLPGALVIVAADLPWETGWRPLSFSTPLSVPAELRLGYLLGLPEASIGGLNLRLLLLTLGTFLAIQPYRYPARVDLRRGAGVAVLATVSGAALATALLERAELGVFLRSVGPWLAVVGALAVVPREVPGFLGGRGDFRWPKQTGTAIIPLVGSVFILLAPHLHWWGVDGILITPVDFAFNVRPDLYMERGSGVLGPTIVVIGAVAFITALVAVLRKNPLPSWVSLLGVAVFVYAATFQAFWIYNGGDASAVAPGVWVGAFGGLMLAVGNRFSWRQTAGLAGLFAIAFVVWSRAGALADERWSDVSSSEESVAVGLVGLGAAALVALAVAIADAWIGRPLLRRPWRRLALIVAALGLAGGVLFASGENLFEDEGGYWGSIVGSIVTLSALAGVGLTWTSAKRVTANP